MWLGRLLRQAGIIRWLGWRLGLNEITGGLQRCIRPVDIIIKWLRLIRAIYYNIYGGLACWTGAGTLGGGSGDGKGSEVLSESAVVACSRTRGDRTAIARATVSFLFAVI